MDFRILDAFVDSVFLNSLDHCDQALQGSFLRVVYRGTVHDLDERNLLL